MSDMIAELLADESKVRHPTRSDEARNAPAETLDGARNGISFNDVAQSGIRVFMACMKGYHVDQPDLWVFAAREATRQIEISIASGTDFTPKAMAAYVAGWADPGVPFDSRDELEKLSFECVVRHWWNLLVSDTMPDIASTESLAMKAIPAFLEKRMGKPIPHLNGHTNGVVKAEPAKNVIEVIDAMPKKTVGLVGRPFYTTPPPIASTVTEMIDIRIASMERQIAALKAFKTKIGPDDDEALWNLFGPVLSKE